MRSTRRLSASRAMGALAIVTLPAFVLVGWWQLLVSVGLAVGATIVAPGESRVPAEGRLHRRLSNLTRRFHRHAWRPGRR